MPIAQYDRSAVFIGAAFVKLLVVIFAAILGPSACAGDPSLLNIRQEKHEGPDEFGLLPTKP